MTELERTLLQYLADEQFCPPFAFAYFASLNGGENPEQAAAEYLAEWEARGWVERIEPRPGEILSDMASSGDLLRLTERGHAAHPWLTRAR